MLQFVSLKKNRPVRPLKKEKPGVYPWPLERAIFTVNGLQSEPPSTPRVGVQDRARLRLGEFPLIPIREKYHPFAW